MPEICSKFIDSWTRQLNTHGTKERDAVNVFRYIFLCYLGRLAARAVMLAQVRSSRSVCRRKFDGLVAKHLPFFRFSMCVVVFIFLLKSKSWLKGGLIPADSCHCVCDEQMETNDVRNYIHSFVYMYKTERKEAEHSWKRVAWSFVLWNNCNNLCMYRKHTFVTRKNFLLFHNNLAM